MHSSFRSWLLLAVGLGLGLGVFAFVLFGELPAGFFLLVLLPGAGRRTSTLSGVPLRWVAAGGDVEARGPLNKGRFGLPPLLRCGAVNLHPAGHGGEGMKRNGAICCGFGVGAGRWTSGAFGRACCWPERIFPVVELLWLEPKTMRESAGPSLNKALLICRFAAGAQRLTLPSAGRGDKGEGGCEVAGYCVANLRQGSPEAAPRRSSMAAHRRLPSLMVERRPLHPFFVGYGFFRPATDGDMQPPGRCAISEALWLWCSWLPVPHPKWFVPGGGVLGCAILVRCSGDGAGPDCVPKSISRVFGAICMGLLVIFKFLWSSMYSATAMNISF